MNSNDSVWDLFTSCFAIGEEVVVVDHFDQVIAGCLTTISEDYCIIRSVFTQKDRRVDWDEVVFFCHDGFPMKKMRYVGAEALLKLDTEDTQQAIRKALTHSYDCVEEKWILRDGTEGRSYRPINHLIRGDPFLIENVSASIYHPGNSGPEFWKTDREETVLLEASDGAKANMYLIPTVFEIEFAA